MPVLTGKRILVTGASSGIGRAVAVRCAEAGATVAAAGRDPERTAQTRLEIEAAGGTAIEVLGELSIEAEAQAVVDGAAQGLGGLDAVVNNAGIDVAAWAPLHKWETAAFDSVVAANLRAPFLVSKYALPHLLAAGGGSIVHMSSVCAITVWAGDCAYGISKAGLNMLSDHIAVEYGPQGVRSNTLMPGVIETALHRAVMEGMNDDHAFERELLRRHPIARFGTPDEVAEACVFLCSDAARFMTGANISIDGAYSRV